MEFTPNIWIKEGGFALSVISSVTEAIDFLASWPQDRRGPFYYLAVNSLQSAVAGSIETREAREVFEIFCREAGILAESRMED